jgi:hypothetical protein
LNCHFDRPAPRSFLHVEVKGTFYILTILTNSRTLFPV